MIGKDVFFAFLGLCISILIAVAANPVVRKEFMEYIKVVFGKSI
jgi:hypothetical protein